MGILTIHNYQLIPSNFLITTIKPQTSLLPSHFHLKQQVHHFNQISLCKRGLTKIASLSGQPEQNPVMDDKKKKVVIKNKKGEKLVGVLHENGSKDIVVLCHGFRSSKESSLIMSLASALDKEGISAFCFDFSGNGESEGSWEYGNYLGETDDLRSVIEHFHEANRVTSAILGHSKGGSIVLLYASKYRDVKRVINVCGRYNTRGGVEERLGKGFLERVKEDGFIDVKDKTGEILYRVTEESLMDRWNTNMHEACLQIDKDCKVLTVHGSDDSTVRVEEALEVAKVIPNHKLQIIEGADHRFSNHRDELTSSVLSFLKEP